MSAGTENTPLFAQASPTIFALGKYILAAVRGQHLQLWDFFSGSSQWVLMDDLLKHVRMHAPPGIEAACTQENWEIIMAGDTQQGNNRVFQYFFQPLEEVNPGDIAVMWIRAVDGHSPAFLEFMLEGSRV